MSDYHINLFYSEEDGGYIADISRPEVVLGLWENAGTSSARQRGMVGDGSDAREDYPDPAISPGHLCHKRIRERPVHLTFMPWDGRALFADQTTHPDYGSAASATN